MSLWCKYKNVSCYGAHKRLARNLIFVFISTLLIIEPLLQFLDSFLISDLDLFIQLRTAALRLIVRCWLDVPNLATRRLHA
jgi:hypothetical protein